VGCKGVVAFFSPGMSTGNSTWCESILLFFLHAENTNKIPYYGRGTKKKRIIMFHLWNDCSISREESFLCQFLLITCARLSLKRSPATATATTLWALALTFPTLFLKCKFGISPLNFKAGKCYCTPRVLYALSCFLVRKS